MRRLFWLLPFIAIGAAVWYVYKLRTAPPEVSFTKAKRERLISAVSTNGKVEPVEWTSIRSDREGPVTRISVEKGQSVEQSAVIAEIDSTDARTDLASSEARIAQAKAELDQLDKGGRARDIVDINGSLERAKLDLAASQRQRDSLQRLVDKKAATPFELDQAKEKIETLKAEIRSLEMRRESLVSVQDKSVAQAKIREAEAAAAIARRRIELSVIRAPIAGTLYQLEIRKGAFLHAGDLVANIGRLDRVRVNVFVDEPELGSIRIGLPVTITWEALPGKQWTGTVAKLPTQVVALQSRQVGEVACMIDNPDRLLIPQTNVNAEIRTNVVDNAITIPKEVLRRQSTEAGVYVLQPDSRISWRKVKLGASSVTRLQVLEGLSDGERVALPTDLPLRDGLVVKPVAGDQ